MCRQEVYLKNYVDWKLVRGVVKVLIWIGIISSNCSLSLINEALLRVFMDRVPKRSIMVRTGDELWFDDRCVLAHRVKQRAYRVWSPSRMQANWEEYRMARRNAQLVYEDPEQAPNRKFRTPKLIKNTREKVRRNIRRNGFCF